MTQNADRPLASLALLCFAFALPVSDGSFLQIGVMSLMLLIFTVAVLFTYRKEPGFLRWLKHHHPLAFWFFTGWLLSSTGSLLLVLLGDATALHKGASAWRHVSVLLYTLLCFAIARTYLQQKLSAVTVFMVLAAGLMLLLVLYFLIYLFGPTPDGGIWARFPPFGTHVRNIGNVGAVVAVTSALLFLNRVAIRHGRWFVPLVVFASWSFIVWNGGRSSMAASLLTVVFFAVYSLLFAKASIRHLAILALLIAAAFYTGDRLSVFGWNGLQRAVAVTTNRPDTPADTAKTNEHALHNDITSGRLVMWRISLEAVKEKPWFGPGPYGYYFIPGSFDDDQPHNMLVQFLVEWGIIGTAMILGLLLYCAIYGLRQLPAAFRERDFSYILCAATILELTMDGMTAGTYFKFLPMVCLCIAFAAFPFARTPRKA